MALPMTRPTKNKKTGIYELRKRVPADLVALIGKTHIKRSLKTKDPETAKALLPEALRKLQNEWAALRAGPSPIPHRELVALAGEHYRCSMDMLEDEPGEPAVWDALLALLARLDASPEHLRQWYGPTATTLLSEKGLCADALSFDRFLQELHSAKVQWAEQQLKRSKGDYSPDPKADRFPVGKALVAGPAVSVGNSLTELFKLWELDHLANGKSPRTVPDFRQKLRSFTSFIGHDDAKRVTPANVSDWCDHLRHKEGLKAATVSAKYLTALKAVIHAGTRRGRLDSDPTKGISVAYNKKRKRERSTGFTDAEAEAILSAAVRDPSSLGRMAEHNKLAIRWGPWICAYTGARVGEIMQLRREDLVVEHGILCLRITPEAGTTKTGNYRLVPIHPHLVEQGLVRYIEESPSGPLFYRPKGPEDDPVTRAGNVAKKIGIWVRKTVGIRDLRLQPNHAWRHRFKTVSREVDISDRYADALQGHEDGSASAGYGETTVKALYREIKKLPRYPGLPE